MCTQTLFNLQDGSFHQEGNGAEALNCCAPATTEALSGPGDKVTFLPPLLDSGLRGELLFLGKIKSKPALFPGEER